MRMWILYAVELVVVISGMIFIAVTFNGCVQ